MPINRGFFFREIMNQLQVNLARNCLCFTNLRYTYDHFKKTYLIIASSGFPCSF